MLAAKSGLLSLMDDAGAKLLHDVDEVDLRRDVAEYLTQLFNEQLIAERDLQ